MGDFREQLLKRKGCLRPALTTVKNADGKVLIEERSSDGIYHVTLQKEVNLGYVVDTHPDMRCFPVIGNLFLSSQDVAQDLQILKANSITHILNVASGVVNAYEKMITYKTVEAYDDPGWNILNIVDECCDFIVDSLAVNGSVLVHCNAGLSRAPSIVIAFLIKKHDMNVQSALDLIRINRPDVKPNYGFLQQLEKIDFVLPNLK